MPRSLILALADPSPKVRREVAGWLHRLNHVVAVASDRAGLLDLCRTSCLRLDATICDVDLLADGGLPAGAGRLVVTAADWTPARLAVSHALGAVRLGKPLLPVGLLAVLPDGRALAAGSATRRADETAVAVAGS